MSFIPNWGPHWAVLLSQIGWYSLLKGPLDTQKLVNQTSIVDHTEDGDFFFFLAADGGLQRGFNYFSKALLAICCTAHFMVTFISLKQVMNGVRIHFMFSLLRRPRWYFCISYLPNWIRRGCFPSAPGWKGWRGGHVQHKNEWWISASFKGSPVSIRQIRNGACWYAEGAVTALHPP